MILNNVLIIAILFSSVTLLATLLHMGCLSSPS